MLAERLQLHIAEAETPGEERIDLLSFGPNKGTPRHGSSSTTVADCSPGRGCHLAEGVGGSRSLGAGGSPPQPSSQAKPRDRC